MAPPELVEAGPVSLVRWRPDRIDDLDAAVNESLPELMPFMPWATEDHDIDDTRAYVEQSVTEWDAGVAWNYAIVAGTGSVVGSCGLMTRMGPGVLEIGYWVHSEWTGRGYATAVATSLAEVALAMPGIDRVVIRHDVANPASGRVAARAGFTEVARADGPRAAPGQTGVELVWERRRVGPAPE